MWKWIKWAFVTFVALGAAMMLDKYIFTQGHPAMNFVCWLIYLWWGIMILTAISYRSLLISQILMFIMLFAGAILTQTTGTIWYALVIAIVVSYASTAKSWQNADQYEERTTYYEENWLGEYKEVGTTSRIVTSTPLVVITSLIFYITFTVLGVWLKNNILLYILVVWAALKLVITFLTYKK